MVHSGSLGRAFLPGHLLCPMATGTGSLAHSWTVTKWPMISRLGAGFRCRSGSHTSSIWLGSLSGNPTFLSLFTLL